MSRVPKNRARAEWKSDDLRRSEVGGGRELVQSWGDLEIHVPLSEDWTARARATTGSTAGNAPPVHRSFFLGGAVPDRVA